MTLQQLHIFVNTAAVIAHLHIQIAVTHNELETGKFNYSKLVRIFYAICKHGYILTVIDGDP